jgi:4-alpha-glucanotransferase
LPGGFGIGDFGGQARAFVDFLATAGQRLWQVLPLGPTGYGNSPYQSLSAFAGNTLLIDPHQLVADGLLAAPDIVGPTFAEDRVEFEPVRQFKAELLGQAYENFKREPASELGVEFAGFCDVSAWWLDDYALFRALKDEHGGSAWTSWDRGLSERQPAALENARAGLRDPIARQKFFQFLFFRQWTALRGYCHARDIRVIGDLPIFVAHDSADVWVHPEYFELDDSGKPLRVAGVPPDYFSETGQLWGNPVYDWEHARGDGFKWWIDRVRFALAQFDLLRIDHFRGFAACWEIPAGDTTAERGRWVEAPGKELFTMIGSALGHLPIIAEDLGEITPDVYELLDQLGFPGMRVMQFGFGGDLNNIHLPHNYPRNVVAYTATHDSDTTVSWFNHLADHEKEFCLRYLHSDGKEINWDLIYAVLASDAETAIIPLQDVLGLGTEARMNLPNSLLGNWVWRYGRNSLSEKHSERLRALVDTYGRIRTTV